MEGHGRFVSKTLVAKGLSAGYSAKGSTKLNQRFANVVLFLVETVSLG